MKNSIFLLIFFGIFFQMVSCTSSETMSIEKHYKCKLGEYSGNVRIYLQNGPEKYNEIITADSIYNIDIPAMRGGFTSFFGIKINDHEPNDYKVVRLVKDGIIIREFSINDLEKTRKLEDGILLLSI